MKRVQQGFSLIEVLVALVMVSITLTSLMTLQNSLQAMLYRDTYQWKAEQFAMQTFADAHKKELLEPGKAVEQESEGFKIVYTVLKPQDKSQLAEIKDLIIEKVTVSWTRLTATQTFVLTKLSYRQKPSEKEKAPEKKSPEVKTPGVTP